MDADMQAAEPEDDDAAELDNDDTAELDSDDAAEPAGEAAEAVTAEAPDDDDADPQTSLNDSEDVVKRRARALAHKNENYRSSALLEDARKTAKEKHSYDSAKARETMREECKKRSGKKIVPHDWQLDVAECLLLGVDCELIAPTGAGKTIPFVLPLFYAKEKLMIIISPLNALEEDQARRFRELEIPAVPVNGTTYTDKLHKEIANGKHRIIVTSPNMCLEHERFRSLLNSPPFARKVCGFIIDEAHCITQWGEKFREIYLQLGTLRAFVSARVSFLVTSATLTPSDLAFIRKSIHLDKKNTYHLNLGNDRPNLAWRVVNMKAGKSDLDSLKFLLPTEREPKLKRSIVFFDDIAVSMEACRWFRKQLPPNLRDCVACYNSRRGESSKRDSYQRFCDGELDIWFASEAAGIGCDIPKIEVVAQFMVPASLSIWLQRAGRAARQRGDHGVAYLLVQPTVFQEKGKKTREEGDDIEYVKAIEDGLRRWIETVNCRRDIADDYFFNPPDRDEPVDICCDNCQASMVDARPSTPDNDDAASIITHPTPSKTRNPHGKRVMRDSELGPAKRAREHLDEAKKALKKWRSDTWFQQYSLTPYGVEAVLPDNILDAFAGHGHWRSINDVTEAPAARWKWLQRHGADVFAVLKKVDDDLFKKRDSQKRANLQARKAETAKKNEEKARKKKEEQARKREERERKKEERKRQPPPPKSRASRARKSKPPAPVPVPVQPMESANITNVLPPFVPISIPKASPQYPPPAPPPFMLMPSTPVSGTSRSNDVPLFHNGSLQRHAARAAGPSPTPNGRLAQYPSATPIHGGKEHIAISATTPMQASNFVFAPMPSAGPSRDSDAPQQPTPVQPAYVGFAGFPRVTPVRYGSVPQRAALAATHQPPGYYEMAQYSRTATPFHEHHMHQRAAVAATPPPAANIGFARMPIHDGDGDGNVHRHAADAATPPLSIYHRFAQYRTATPSQHAKAHQRAAVAATPPPPYSYGYAQSHVGTFPRNGDVSERMAADAAIPPPAGNPWFAHDPRATSVRDGDAFQHAAVAATPPPPYAYNGYSQRTTRGPARHSDVLQRVNMEATPPPADNNGFMHNPEPVREADASQRAAVAGTGPRPHYPTATPVTHPRGFQASNIGEFTMLHPHFGMRHPTGTERIGSSRSFTL